MCILYKFPLQDHMCSKIPTFSLASTTSMSCRGVTWEIQASMQIWFKRESRDPKQLQSLSFITSPFFSLSTVSVALKFQRSIAVINTAFVSARKYCAYAAAYSKQAISYVLLIQSCLRVRPRVRTVIMHYSDT